MNPQLPPLPEPFEPWDSDPNDPGLFTASQMATYATEAVEEERRRCGQWIYRAILAVEKMSEGLNNGEEA